MISTASLLGAQQKRNGAENQPASLLVVSLGKPINGMPLSSCGRQVAGPSNLSVVVAQSNCFSKNKRFSHTKEKIWQKIERYGVL